MEHDLRRMRIKAYMSDLLNNNKVMNQGSKFFTFRFPLISFFL